MVKIKTDTIQLIIMLIACMTLIGGFWNYCEGHFAKAADLQNEIEERRELKIEIDQMYLRIIPTQDQIPLHYSPRRNNQ